jgi:hypothetical protein
MRIGIVGAEAAKFTPRGLELAKSRIREIIRDPQVSEVCSGECPLGGIDIWAREIAGEIGKPFTPFPPKTNVWSTGYKPRNLQIANWSDKVFNLTVSKLPDDFSGMKFKLCYHCANHGFDAHNHVKSGGCWTMYKCKEGELIIIDNT